MKPKPKNHEFAGLVKVLRGNCSLSQEYVAQQLNVSVRAVKYWEAGSRVPGVTTLARLALLLEATVQEFIHLRVAAYGPVKYPVPDLISRLREA